MDARYCLRCGTPLETRDARLACPKAGCGYIHYDNPLPVVAALVEHQGEVILARNKGWPANWYGLITGFLERGESPEEGVLREVKEELGLTGEVVRLIGVYPFQQRNELIVAYHLRAEGEIKLGDELDSYKRVPPDKLKPWPFATGLAVADWLKSRD